MFIFQNLLHYFPLWKYFFKLCLQRIKTYVKNKITFIKLNKTMKIIDNEKMNVKKYVVYIIKWCETYQVNGDTKIILLLVSFLFVLAGFDRSCFWCDLDLTFLCGRFLRRFCSSFSTRRYLLSWCQWSFLSRWALLIHMTYTIGRFVASLQKNKVTLYSLHNIIKSHN